MQNIFRTSEFWMAVIVALGQGGTAFGLWQQNDWSLILYPALVYILGRIMSKVAKAVA